MLPDIILDTFPTKDYTSEVIQSENDNDAPTSIKKELQRFKKEIEENKRDIAEYLKSVRVETAKNSLLQSEA
jgi:hypothetical protein